MSEDWQRYLNTAVEAARRAGEYLLENWGRLPRESIDEKVKNDFVTSVDRTSEQMIVDHLLSHFPDHGILAEEGGNRQTGRDFQWVIDPLDGTTNFIHDISIFSISIALLHQHRPHVGVVVDPFREEVYTAIRGAGAALNNLPIRVSPQTDFSRSFLATGFPHHSKPYLPQYVKSFSEIYLHCAGVRRLGSAALDLCYTACGRFEAFWELGLNTWDIAAGSLIVREAGGVVSDFWGKETYLESGFIIAGSRPIHQHLKHILSFHFGGE